MEGDIISKSFETLRKSGIYVPLMGPAAAVQSKHLIMPRIAAKWERLCE